jgi:hypothetical protein
MVADARAQRTPPVWSVSLGHDASGRDQALLPHVKAGRISARWMEEFSTPFAIGLDALLALPAPEGAAASTIEARNKARADLKRLRDEMVNGVPGPSHDALAKKSTDERKKLAADMVAEYERNHPDQRSVE